jgi:hypothetical protein
MSAAGALLGSDPSARSRSRIIPWRPAERCAGAERCVSLWFAAVTGSALAPSTPTSSTPTRTDPSSSRRVSPFLSASCRARDWRLRVCTGRRRRHPHHPPGRRPRRWSREGCCGDRGSPARAPLDAREIEAGVQASPCLGRSVGPTANAWLPVEVSAQVWPNHDHQIGGSSRRPLLAPLMLACASSTVATAVYETSETSAEGSSTSDDPTRRRAGMRGDPAPLCEPAGVGSMIRIRSRAGRLTGLRRRPKRPTMCR